MTLLAGAYSRSSQRPIPAELAQSLKRNLSRHPKDSVVVRDGPGFFLAQVDLGAFDGHSFHIDQQEDVSLVTGEPLLTHVQGNRSSDLKALHKAWLENDLSVIRSACGTFSGCHMRGDSSELRLFTDHLGVRPLYFWIGDQIVVFASALRILESCPQISRNLDVRGVTEMAAFGYSLHDRTPYREIHRIGAAEIVRLRGRELHRFRYWNWDEELSANKITRESLEQLYHRFKRAVARRQRSDAGAVAFLSGGLDSRAVTSTLADAGVRAHTFNFAIPGAQDQVFARLFAAVAGTRHTEIPRHGYQGGWAAMISRAWNEVSPSEREEVERPQIVWSGDGGSVVVGHVYLTQRIADLLRIGKTDEAIALYAQRQAIGVPKRILRRHTRPALTSMVQLSVAEELARFDCDDPARSFHLFLLENDQRRHLDRHFESIDLNRIEYQLPFFDRTVVQSALSFTIDDSIHHRLYVRWLECFPRKVRSVPWQAYPGAVPCPIPHPVELSHQWEDEQVNAFTQERQRKLLRETRGGLRERSFPADILRRRVIQLAYWMLRFRIRDTTHILRFAEVYMRYHQRCNEPDGGRDSKEV